MPSSAPSAAPVRKSGKGGLILGCIVCLLLGAFIGHAITYHWMDQREAPGVKFTTPYQAVVLSNGTVFYGRLTGYGTHNPQMTDVFYIVTKTDPTTKQISNLLVKRGKELHGPDRMYLNPSSIVIVEPVGEHSKVAQLISEAGQ